MVRTRTSAGRSLCRKRNGMMSAEDGENRRVRTVSAIAMQDEQKR